MDKGGFDALKTEIDRVFCSPATGFLPTTASFYTEGRDDGAKRVEMTEFILQSRFRKNNTAYKENEDHIGFVFMFMQRLLMDSLQGDEDARALSGRVFTNILNLFLDDFANQLMQHGESGFFKQVALILRSFTELERVYHNVCKPEPAGANKSATPEKETKKKQECVKLESSCV